MKIVRVLVRAGAKRQRGQGCFHSGREGELPKANAAANGGQQGENRKC